MSLNGEIVDPREPYRWKPGQSGNPGGMTREHREILKLLRDRSSDALFTLHDIMTGRIEASAATRAFCAVNWLHMAFGKPKQTIDMAERGRTLEQILDAIAAAREAEARAEAQRERSE